MRVYSNNSIRIGAAVMFLNNKKFIKVNEEMRMAKSGGLYTFNFADGFDFCLNKLRRRVAV